MKFFVILVFVFVSFSSALAQPSFRLIPSEILSSKISQDESLLACSTADSVYIIDAASFVILKKWAHHQETPVILGFHPVNNNILLLQQQRTGQSQFSGGLSKYGLSMGAVLENYRSTDKKYNELPGDSISMWDISKPEIVNTSAGNFYYQFGNAPNSMVAISNRVFPYQSQGMTLYSSTRSDIKTMDGGFSFTSQQNKSCRKLLLSPNRKYFAVSWRDGYKGDSLFFSFSIHDFKTHEIIFKIDQLTEPLTDFCFSANEQLLALSYNKEQKPSAGIEIIDISNRKTIRTLPGTEGSMNLGFSANGKEIFFLDKKERDWADYDLESGRVIHKVWAKLISSDYITFTHLSGEKLFVAAAFSIDEPGKPIGSNKSFMVRTVNMNDMKVFTKTLEEKVSILFDSSKYMMVMNDVPINNNQPVLNFTYNRHFFSRVDNKTQLQVWNAIARKKIFQTGFEASIMACPDKTGRSILIVENNVQRSYSEYQFHLINIANGLMRSSAVLEEGEGKMNGSFYKLNLVPHPFEPMTWYALDGSRSVWIINGTDLSMKKLMTLEEGQPFDIQFQKNGDLYILAKMKNDSYSVWISAKGTELRQAVTGSSKASMQLLGEQVLMWNYTYSGDSTIEVWSNGNKQKTIQVSGKIQMLDALPDGKKCMVYYQAQGKNLLQYLEDNVLQEPVDIRIISGRLRLIKADEVLVENDGFASLIQNGRDQFSWTVRTPQMLDNTNFDISSGGNYALLGNRVINLRDIQQWDLNRYANACLLQDSGKLSWAEIYSEGSYGSKTGGFSIYRYTEGKKDTVKSRTWISEPKTGDNFYFKHDQIIASPDKQWAISFVRQGMLNSDFNKAPPMVWDLKKMTGQVIPVNKKNYSLAFSADGKRIICTSWENKSMLESISQYEMSVYQLSPFKLIRTRKNIPAEKLTDPAEGEQFVMQYRGIDWLIPDADSLKVKKSFFSKQDLSKYIYSARAKKLIGGSSSGNLVIWEVNGGASPVKILNAHSAPVIDMAIRGDRVYSLAENGEIGITSLDEDSLKVVVRTLVKDDELRIAMSTADGYFRVDPDLMKDLQFVNNGEIFPLSSFELQGNRPDKVYEALGLADTSFIAALRESWKSRIRKAGFDPEKTIDNQNRPLVKWDRSSLPAITSDSILPVRFEVTAMKGELSSIYLRINGVPLGSKRGIPVGAHQQKVLVEEKIPLTRGNNYISVVAVNDQGVESLEQDIDIRFENGRIPKTRLIYLGIGISDYADSSMNLRYAAKDIKDISERLHYYFDSVELHTLTNEQASRENILSLKKHLQETGTEDLVMVSFSGHGVIAPGKGFYFAPYDMKFADPSAKGLSMEMIDDLLDDIPARKRLLLLDACHSGEEWEGSEGSMKLPEGVTAVKPRGGITTSSGEYEGGNKQLGFLLMKELFGDFSRGNGAFMISAAGSNEFAFEGEEWKNGVFTKSLLEALAVLRYKGSYDKQVPVKIRELRKLIYEKVSALTNGRQNPTSRQENGWWNWSF